MDQIRAELAAWMAPHTDGMTPSEILDLMGPVKDPELGDIALPCFRVRVGDLKKPDEKAAKLAANLGEHEMVAKIEAVKGYLNITLKPQALAAHVMPAVDGWVATDFVVPTGKGNLVTIDFSSPNIAKEFSLGHLRSTMLGNSIVRLYQALGWQTVGINHLGDWGHQFGVVIVAFSDEGNETDLSRDPIGHLQSLYTRYSMREKAEGARAKSEAAGKAYDPAHTFAVKNEKPDDAKARIASMLAEDPYLADPKLPTDTASITARARRTDEALQAGDAKIRELWKRFRELSLDALRVTYADLGVEFDAYTGESFFEDRMAPVIERAANLGILVESEGARVVEMGDGKPPCILVKKDGGTTYATRDLAAAIYRRDEYKFERNLYVVDKRQAGHFEQVFSTLGKLGFEWAANCQHVPFGAVRVDGEVMSTRMANVILLEDYIQQNQDCVLKIMGEKNPGLKDELGADAYATTARAVAKAAIIFEMLKIDRNKDVDYRSEQAVNFEGETGPRVQMVYAKTGSVRRNYEAMFGEPHDESKYDLAHFDTVYERQLLRLLGDYPAIVAKALEDHQPYIVANYALEISDWLNRYWRNVRFLDENNRAAADSRVSLLARVRRIIARCLWLLGIESPERM